MDQRTNDLQRLRWAPARRGAGWLALTLAATLALPPPCFGPNEKIGIPEGGGPNDGTVGIDGRINYEISFENSPDATAAVQQLRIRDDLDVNLDWTTVRLGAVALSRASKEATVQLDPVEQNQQVVVRNYRVVLPVPGGVDEVEVRVDVAVSISFDPDIGVLRWAIGLLLPPAEPFVGFLPPNDDTGRGEGFVRFSVAPRADLVDGTTVNNGAEITFDRDAPILTNSVVHKVSRFLPPGVPSDPVPPHDPGLPDNPGLPPIDQPVVLAWQAARAASFGLTLWRGDEAEPLVVERGLTQSSFALARLDPDTDFRWQVVAVSANNDTTAGPTWRFHTAPAAQKSPGEPADPNPPDGASNVSLTPELSWAPAEGASFYQVFLWPSSEVDPMDPVVRVSEPVFVLVDPLEASHQYSWRVEASNSFGSTSSPTWTFETGLAKGVLFSRGDANADTSIDISDAIFILAFLFLGGADPVCHESLDIDDGGDINITDAVNLLVGLFLGGTEPAPPFPECGLDPTPNDGQTCESFPPCQ